MLPEPGLHVGRLVTARALALALGVLAVAAVPRAATAQWTAVATESGTGSGADARVRNDEGAELRIWLDADDALRAAFRLPSGLVRLDPRGCPTFQIDDKPPEDLSAADHECTADGDRARVLFARAEEGRVDSPSLLELMNGSRLVVRYRLDSAGYGATSFSLRGSKQALTTALGEVTVIEP